MNVLKAGPWNAQMAVVAKVDTRLQEVSIRPSTTVSHGQDRMRVADDQWTGCCAARIRQRPGLVTSNKHGLIHESKRAGLSLEMTADAQTPDMYVKRTSGDYSRTRRLLDEDPDG